MANYWPNSLGSPLARETDRRGYQATPPKFLYGDIGLWMGGAQEAHTPPFGPPYPYDSPCGITVDMYARKTLGGLISQDR